ncbi:spore coat protein [Bacillus sp. FJAT-42376]|uniref:CotY/CotZ family spore coat protein n=1 Tax=Bacillus sp. FJAT-42376 TaxID=2014076 RepID=UPI000F4F1EE2|nr:CotY/CotZ family spore coat protein [Bacillus sp. FJAT-42376]AZB42395.1 spore coat protein [Bacillus sp. FJAT-42376]
MIRQKDFGCVCDAVENINDLQNAVEEQCSTSCFSNLLSPANTLGDTIPFILYTKKGTPFKAYGNVGGLTAGDCFNTIFFRVENINGCCATLRLLIAFGEDTEVLDFHENSPCDVFRLEKTDFCIEVDLNCFCSIQCLSPRLINRTHSD